MDRREQRPTRWRSTFEWCIPNSRTSAANSLVCSPRTKRSPFGYSEREIAALVRSRRWVRLRRGVFTTPDVIELPDLRDRVRRVVLADCLCIGATATASHQSAVVEHELWLLRRPESVEPAITLPPGSLSRSVASHVYRATLADLDRWRAGPLLVTSPARTVIDAARHLPFEEAVVVADSALNRGLVDERSLMATLQRCEGWPGWRRAAAVLEFADGRSQSPYESLARVRSVQHGLPAPEPQAPVLGSDDRTYWVDLYWKKRADDRRDRRQDQVHRRRRPRP